MKNPVVTFGSLVLAVLVALSPGCSSDGAGNGCIDGEACSCSGGSCDLTCDGAGGAGCSFVCDDGATCVFDCPGGGCSVDCGVGSSCTLSCAGDGCEQNCNGSDVCVLEACDERCVLDCNGADTCESSCDLDEGCVVTP